MTDNKVALLRFPAFIIDITLVMLPLYVLTTIGKTFNLFNENIPIEWLMFCYIPMMFFIYWVLKINVGKRIFGLSIVDANTGNKATVFQLFKRSLLFSLIVSFNLAFIIPLFVSKKHQSFHDMLANTVVVKNPKK